jgi:hypothetical protein
MSHCLFDGVFVPKLTIIWGFETNNSLVLVEVPKYKGIVVTIDDCEFRHCIIEGEKGKIIQLQSHHLNIFKQGKWDTTVDVRNCRGLENVNKEGELTEEVTILQETSTGKPIGARLDEATVGVPGYTQIP